VEVAVETGAEAVRADEQRLMELLGALVRNAVGFGSDSPAITLHARRVGERVVIEFSDDGPGVAPEIAPKVFLPLFKGQAPGGGLPQGLGLGLTNAAGLARLMGGEVRLEGRARFVVDLPAAERPTVSDE
jgi:signal transduction histidine kinase